MRKWIFLLLVLTGCGGPKDKCGKDFLVLWPNADGAYQFQPLRLDTLSSPYELQGEAAQVFVESLLTESSGYSGQVARPHLTRADGVCVPTDINSALAVSAYAQMERLYSFDRNLGVAGQIPWPRKVGVQIHLNGEDTLIRNNALYFSKHDAIALVPYTAGALPAPVNLGVVAHEHFHAHFQHQVYGPLNAMLAVSEMFGLSLERFFHPLVAAKSKPEDIDKADVGTERGVNTYVLRAWNEGLADFYGYVYTGRTGFVGESLPIDILSRDLAGKLEPMQTNSNFRDAIRETGVSVGYAYTQGTLLARLLYQVAEGGLETKEMLLTRILNQLPKVAIDSARRFDNEYMDFDTIVPILLEGMPLNASICRALGASISKATLQRSFVPCSGK
jgi:hypothetical protein